MTTNTNDLRAAAERAVQWYETPNVPDACHNMPDHVYYAGYFACREYLAEHAADDDEPWDMEWLRSVGFVGDFKKHGPGMWLPGSDISITHDKRWVYGERYWPFKPIVTRGDLRMACEFIGRPLPAKETT